LDEEGSHLLHLSKAGIGWPGFSVWIMCMFDMMGRVSIEHLFRQVQGQHKALARRAIVCFCS